MADYTHLVRMPDDIAVLEQNFGGDWRTLCYIGPNRGTTIVESLVLYQGMSIRVRYLSVADVSTE